MVESWGQLQSDTERVELLAFLKRWAGKFRITEDWILSAALHTLFLYAPRPPNPTRDEDWLWRYQAEGFHPTFSFTPDKKGKSYWYPPEQGWNENWDAFKRRMEGQFSKQLASYRRDVERIFSVGRDKEKMAQDAAWTVRYQKGESAIEIVEADNLLDQKIDPDQFVFRRISRHAKLIGLNLRRRGERLRQE
jgi:hypothetical protein